MTRYFLFILVLLVPIGQVQIVVDVVPARLNIRIVFVNSITLLFKLSAAYLLFLIDIQVNVMSTLNAACTVFCMCHTRHCRVVIQQETCLRIKAILISHFRHPLMNIESWRSLLTHSIASSVNTLLHKPCLVCHLATYNRAITFSGRSRPINTMHVLWLVNMTLLRDASRLDITQINWPSQCFPDEYTRIDRTCVAVSFSLCTLISFWRFPYRSLQFPPDHVWSSKHTSATVNDTFDQAAPFPDSIKRKSMKSFP